MGRLGRVALGLVAVSCGSAGHHAGAEATVGSGPGDAGAPAAKDGATAADAGAPAADAAAPPSTCVGAAQLEAWQAEIDQFDGGYRPTGSPAHEGYIQRLAQELAAAGVAQVHTEPYSFTRWTPSAWSLALAGGSAAGPVAASAYVPYSGTTGPLGVTAPLAYLPGSTIPLDATALASALQDPSAWTQALTSRIQASLAASTGQLAGHIVVFEMPELALSLATLTGTTLAVNDPGHTVSMDATITRVDLSAMLVMPAMLDALASTGALAAVGVLDAPEEAARGEYAPFFGPLTANLPALYVDRTVGAALEQAITAPGAPAAAATLVLDAALAPAVSENLVGVLPGASAQQIVVGSHTDGPNSMEDNGPVGILALASCLAQVPVAARPRAVRFVLSGGHFAGSIGLTTYVAQHSADLSAEALAVLELEHLGARQWTEVSPGTMGLTGLPEVQVVYTTSQAPLVAASTALAGGFPRTVVGTPPLLGEGQNFRILPLVQFIAMPEYLLLDDLPVTSQFTDYDLMRRQVLAFVDLERALSVAPADQLGVGSL